MKTDITTKSSHSMQSTKYLNDYDCRFLSPFSIGRQKSVRTKPYLRAKRTKMVPFKNNSVVDQATHFSQKLS